MFPALVAVAAAAAACLGWLEVANEVIGRAGPAKPGESAAELDFMAGRVPWMPREGCAARPCRVLECRAFPDLRFAHDHRPLRADGRRGSKTKPYKKE